jgi:hypothetical protein
MPEQNSKYLNNYLNGVTYENAFWKIQYNELWNRFLYLQNENNRLYSILNECYRETTQTTENTTETTQTAENTTEKTEKTENRENTTETTENIQNRENTTETTENIQNREILSHLQNKNIQLINTVMDKSKEIFMLQGELEKHKMKN